MRLQDIWAEDAPWEHEAPGVEAAGGGAEPGGAPLGHVAYESDEDYILDVGINTFSTGLPMGKQVRLLVGRQTLWH